MSVAFPAVRRWTRPVAYFRVPGPLGTVRVPVLASAHDDLTRGVVITRAFSERYGVPAPPGLQLIRSDEWHLLRSRLDEAAWLRALLSQRGALAVSNTAATFSDFASTLTVSFNPTNADAMVGIAGNDRSGGGTTITGITWNAVSFTLETAVGGPGSQTSRLGRMVGTLNGAQNLVASYSTGNTKPMLLFASFTGVDQTTPYDGLQTTSATAASTSWTVTTTSNGWAIGWALYGTAGLTFTASDTEVSVRTSDFTGVGSGACFRQDGTGGNVSLSWTHTNSQRWGSAVNLRAASAGGGLVTRKALLGVGI